MFERTARLIFIASLFWLPSALAEIAISSARIWPAQDYTRITLESKQPIRYNLFTVKNPERLVIDLDEVEQARQARWIRSAISPRLATRIFLNMSSGLLDHEQGLAEFLTHLRGLRPKNRIVSAFGSYGWGGGAVKEALEEAKKMGLETVEPGIQLLYRPSFEDENTCFAFARGSQPCRRKGCGQWRRCSCNLSSKEKRHLRRMKDPRCVHCSHQEIVACRRT